VTAALCIFARPVIAGRTKTRLSPALGMDGAAVLYRAFLSDTLRGLSALPQVHPTLWVAGDPDHPSLADITVPRRPQQGSDLGARLAAAMLDAPRQAALVIGSDAPTLPPAYLAQAHAHLERGEAPLVLGPTADGGFYLIGARPDAALALRGPLSEVRWSSCHTLGDTLRAAAEQGLAAHLLPPWYDVDGPEDLELLRLHLALAPDAAPATRHALLGLRARSLRA